MKSQQYMAQLSCRFNDIYYNFMFGTNGMVFEGRGFDVVGENMRGRRILNDRQFKLSKLLF